MRGRPSRSHWLANGLEDTGFLQCLGKIAKRNVIKPILVGLTFHIGMIKKIALERRQHVFKRSFFDLLHDLPLLALKFVPALSQAQNPWRFRQWINDRRDFYANGGTALDSSFVEPSRKIALIERVVASDC